MATRRGGRKNAKKGVQFTLMVVGESQMLYVLRRGAILNLCGTFQVRRERDVPPS